ncbi:hypothetical protein PsYK624_131100 [Phanerochaete sordida]|uniref:Uncharacterized protein n=1 Tax=Phanerochaete sordida TaxID=48140 RepID=A0A9P3GKG6_9APHY|nr:hypothetical protein PsYK624_131100 [Phanerochaete sordida]
MHLSFSVAGLAFVVLALAGTGSSTPVAHGKDGAAPVAGDETATYLVSHEQMLHWIATTSAELTFVGAPLNPLTPRSAQNTMVTYCSHRVDNVCGGPCTVYNGGATCLNAPGTNCLAATHNVGFCDRGGCGHSCNQLSTCGTRLDNGFCFTPGTQSILVSAA